MHVTVEFPDQSVVTCPLPSRSTVATLKSHLQLQAGFPAPIQTLLLGDRRLPDQQVLAAEHYLLRLDGSSSFPLRLTVKSRWGSDFHVVVCLSESVRVTKARVERGAGVPVEEQRLYVDGRLLEDSQNLSEVFAPGKFECCLLLPHEFMLGVSLPNSTLISVAATSSDRVCAVLSSLREHHWIDCSEYRPYFQGKEINTFETLQAVGITGPACIECRCSSYYLWAAAFDVPRVKVALSASDSVSQRVARSTERFPSGFLMLYNGKLLPENTLAADIVPGTIVECGDLLLHIRSFNAEKLELVVPSDSFIAAARQEIKKRLRRTAFKLIYRGAELSDTRTFADCGLSVEATVELVDSTDSFIWVESDIDKVAVNAPLSATAAVDAFRAVTGSQDTFDLQLFNGQLPLANTKFEGGGVLVLYRKGRKVQVEGADTVRRVDTSQFLSIPFFQGVVDNQVIPRLSSRLKGSGEQLRLRRSSGRVVSVQYCPSELVKTLKRKVLPQAAPSCLVLGETRLADSSLMGECALQHFDYVDLCLEDELILLNEDSKERFYVSAKGTKVSDLMTQCRSLICEPLLLFYQCFLEKESEELRTLGVSTGACIRAIPLSCYVSDATVTTEPKPNKFIFLERVDSSKHLLRFHDSLTWSDFTAYVQATFHLEDFVLVCSSRLLTSHRFRCIAVGSLIHLYKAEEAVLFQRCGGSVTPVLIYTGLTLAKARFIANVPASYSLYHGRSLLTDSSQEVLCAQWQPGVITCASQREELYCIERAGMAPTFLPLPSFSYAQDFTSHLREVECDSKLQPLCYQQERRMQGWDRLLASLSVFVLLPPQRIVFVTSQFRSPVSVLLESTDTVATLRQAAAKQLKFPGDLRLLYEGSVLADMRTVASYNFATEPVVDALRPCDVVVTVAGLERTVVISCSLAASIRSLRWEVAAKTRVSQKGLALVWEGQVLSDSRCIEDYSRGAELTVQLVQPFETVLRLRSLDCAEKVAIVPAKQVSCDLISLLSEQATAEAVWIGELFPWHSLSAYSLPHDSHLFLVRRRRATTRKVCLYIRKAHRNTVKVKSHLRSTIRDVVRYLSSRICANVEGLIVDGTAAGANKTLMECGLGDGTVVEALLAGQVVVAVTYNGQTEHYAADPRSPVLSLKAEIEVVTGVPTALQLLCSRASVVEDYALVGTSGTALELRIDPNYVWVEATTRRFSVPALRPSAALSELKQELEAATGLAATSQRLLCSDNPVNDDEPIPAAVLTLLSPKDVRLFVHSALATYTVYAKRSAPVDSVLQRLSRDVGLYHTRLSVVAAARVARDEDLQAMREPRRLELVLLVGR